MQDTADLNWKPYKELGLEGTNGWATKITIGPCGRHNTGIDVKSHEAKEYLKKHHHHLCDVEEGQKEIVLPEELFLTE